MPSLTELKEKARHLGIKGFSRMRKPQLEAMIASYETSILGQEFGTQRNCERAPALDVLTVAEELGIEEGTRAEMCEDIAAIANKEAVDRTEIPNVTRCNAAPRALVEDKVIRAGQSTVDDQTGRRKSKKNMCDGLFRRRTVGGVLSAGGNVNTYVRKYSVSQLIDMCKEKNIIWHYTASEKPLPKAQLCNLLFGIEAPAEQRRRTSGAPKTAAGCIRSMPLEQVIAQCRERGISTVDANGKRINKKDLCLQLFASNDDMVALSYPRQQMEAPIVPSIAVATSPAVVIQAPPPIAAPRSSAVTRPVPAPRSSFAVSTNIHPPVPQARQQHHAVSVGTSPMRFTSPPRAQRQIGIQTSSDNDADVHTCLSWRNIQNLAMMHGIQPVDAQNKLRTKEELIKLLNNIKSFDSNTEPIEEEEMNNAMLRFTHHEVQQRMLNNNLSLVKDGKLLTKREMIHILSDYADLLDQNDYDLFNYYDENYLKYNFPERLEAPQPYIAMQPLRQTKRPSCILMQNHMTTSNSVHVDDLNRYMTDHALIRPVTENWLEPYMNKVADLNHFPFGKLIAMPPFEDLPNSSIPVGNNTIKTYIPLFFRPKMISPAAWKKFTDLIESYETCNLDSHTLSEMKIAFNITDENITAERERMAKFNMLTEYEEYTAATDQHFYCLEEPIVKTDKEVTDKYIGRLMDIYKVRMEPECMIVQRLADERRRQIAPLPATPVEVSLSREMIAPLPPLLSPLPATPVVPGAQSSPREMIAPLPPLLSPLPATPDCSSTPSLVSSTCNSSCTRCTIFTP
ncbi:hypothetical protein ECIV_ORF81 [European chub iridovirus]|nr:hypothetical protein ECIV_ORF81 [European chub iridovirus]